MTFRHYINAATLPLILLKRSLRFTRSYLMDDASEVPSRLALLDERKFFVSSWPRDTHGGAAIFLGEVWGAARDVRIPLPDVSFFSTLNAGFFCVTDQIKEGGSQDGGLRIREIYTPYGEASYSGGATWPCHWVRKWRRPSVR